MGGLLAGLRNRAGGIMAGLRAGAGRVGSGIRRAAQAATGTLYNADNNSVAGRVNAGARRVRSALGIPVNVRALGRKRTGR